MNRIAGRVQRAQAVEDHAVGVGGGGGQALSEKVQRQRPIREGSSDEEAERSSANTPTKAPSPLPGMESSARRPAAGDLRWKHTAEVFTVARAGADARAPAPRQQVPVLEGNMSPPPATPLRQPSPQCCVACAVLWRVRGGALEPPWHTRRSRPLYRESEKSLATDVWGGGLHWRAPDRPGVGACRAALLHGDATAAVGVGRALFYDGQPDALCAILR